MKSLKVAIIGAGICGLYLAWKLSKRGYPITVFEKREKIGKECCSGLFSERILEFIPEARQNFLKKNLGGQAQNLIEAKYNSCLIHFPSPSQIFRRKTWEGKKTVKINFKKKVFFIEHSKLDNLVAELARNAGAEILLGQELKELPQNFDKIIGCDGPLSFVRRKLNLPNPKFHLGIQKFYPVRNSISNGVEDSPIDVSRETRPLETWPIFDGFLWKIPKNDTTEYGIMAPPLKAEQIFQKFLQKMGVEPTNLKSALIPQGLIIPKNPHITLCGDAAGLTKPWTGGGVIWGLTAAEILLKHFPDFLAYRKEARKFFLPQIIFSKATKKLVYFLGFHFPWLLPRSIALDNDYLFR